VKSGIHPNYEEATVTCGCGESFVTRSTKKKIYVEICSQCHPFYTGKQKFVDSAGRIEKFKRRYGNATAATEPAATATAATAATEPAAAGV